MGKQKGKREKRNVTDEKIEYRFVTNRLFSRIVNHRFSINFRFSSSTPFELTLSVFSSALISCEHRGGNMISDSCCQEEGVKNKKREREGGRGLRRYTALKGKGMKKNYTVRVTFANDSHLKYATLRPEQPYADGAEMNSINTSGLACRIHFICDEVLVSSRHFSLPGIKQEFITNA